MKKLYKLKDEVKEFFPAIKEKVKESKYWEVNQIPYNILDEVSFCEVKKGIKRSKSQTSIGRWNNKDGGKIFATIYFPYISVSEWEKIDRDEIIEHLDNSMKNFLTK